MEERLHQDPREERKRQQLGGRIVPGTRAIHIMTEKLGQVMT
jgi:hypothetical protein